MIWFLLVGLVAGWLAGQLTQGGGFGVIGNIIVGVVGSFVGGFVFSLLGLSARGTAGSIIMATAGAVVFLWLLRVIF